MQTEANEIKNFSGILLHRVRLFLFGISFLLSGNT